jgi:chemotaxis regulatin CheY-phosphate phosphatase CheZ
MTSAATQHLRAIEAAARRADKMATVLHAIVQRADAVLRPSSDLERIAALQDIRMMALDRIHANKETP